MLETIKNVLQLVPTILTIIDAVEKQIPEGGKGKEKLEFVKNALTAAYPQITEMWGTVEKIIGAAVTLFNTTGKFKK